VLSKEPSTAIPMCKYSAFNGPPTSISIVDIRKSFKPTSIPKKLWVKSYSKKL